MSNAVLPVYGPSPVVLERGKGVRLYDDKGREYLDFIAGIAVNSLGHAHPALIKALTDQANKLWNDPRVQTKVEEAKSKAPEVAQTLGDQAKAKAGEVRAKVPGHETTSTTGAYSNETGSIDPTSGPNVDSSTFGPGGDRLP